MTKNKNSRQSPDDHLQRAIYLSSHNLLECGAAVLGESFDFTDKQQAEWIEATAARARDRMVELSEKLKDANEKLKEFNKR